MAAREAARRRKEMDSMEFFIVNYGVGLAGNTKLQLGPNKIN